MPEPQRLVGVAGADAAPGGADRELAELGLSGRVEQHVVGHDQVRVGGDAQVADRDALPFQPVDLSQQHPRVQHHAVADHAGLLRVEDARRDQVELELLALADDRVAGVVAALEAHDHLGPLRKQVGDLSLPLVAPLGADYDHARHERWIVTGSTPPTARAWTRWSGPKSGSGSPQISTRRETVREPICSSSCLLVEVGGDQHRALCLVALVDEGVELLQNPVGALLGTEVVDVEQVDGGEALEEGEVGVAAGLGVVGAADPRQQLRQRVDRDRAAVLEGRFGDQHRQRRLAGAGVAHQPEAAPGVEVRLHVLDPAPHDPAPPSARCRC